MRGRGIGRFFVHTIKVQTRLGAGSNGDIYSAPVTLSPTLGTGVLVDDAIHLVRDHTGQEVTSQGRIAAPLETAPLFTPNSLVTIYGDGDDVIRASRRVITINSADLDGLPEHVMVSLA